MNEAACIGASQRSYSTQVKNFLSHELIHTYTQLFMDVHSTYVHTYLYACLATYINNYIHIHTYRHIHTYIHIQLCMSSYIHIFTCIQHAFIFAFIHICCIHTYIHTCSGYVCMNSYIHADICEYIAMYIHVHIHGDSCMPNTVRQMLMFLYKHGCIPTYKSYICPSI